MFRCLSFADSAELPNERMAAVEQTLASAFRSVRVMENAEYRSVRPGRLLATVRVWTRKR
jgi:hypothetical protein